MLANPPILAYPDFEWQFVLHTDASDKGLGAVLYQSQNGKLRVIGYGLRTLTPAERNYRLHSGKLEFLALKWAVCEKFRDYLFYAPHFTIYTNNNPLTYVMSMAKLNAFGFRWVGGLSDFSFDMKEASQTLTDDMKRGVRGTTKKKWYMSGLDFTLRMCPVSIDTLPGSITASHFTSVLSTPLHFASFSSHAYAHRLSLRGVCIM